MLLVLVTSTTVIVVAVGDDNSDDRSSRTIDQTIENFTTSNLVISKFYTFTKQSSHIKLSTNPEITNKLVHSKKEINFDFRTRYPNVILFHEKFYQQIRQNGSNTVETIFELFLSVHNGRFKVLIDSSEGVSAETDKTENNLPTQHELIIGHGFSDDHLHHVRMYLNMELGFFNIRVNSTHRAKHYHSFYFSSKIVKRLANHETHYECIFGGHSSLTAQANSLSHSPFIGCIGNVNVVLRAAGNNFDTLSSSQLDLVDVEEGCLDQCKRNLCSRKSSCINFYDTKKCNCFGTELEDWHCRSFNYTVVTLRGYSLISYKIYSYANKYYSDDNLISLHIKTIVPDGLLLVALSELSNNYLIINLKNGFLNLLFDFGNNPKTYVFNNIRLSDDEWHNVTLVHQYNHIEIIFDQTIQQVLSLEDSVPYFFFDPEIFIGGLPITLNVSKLNLPFTLPNKKFVGCLKHVYFNRFNILYDLNRNHKMAKYHSPLPLELGCPNQTFHSIPMTFNARSFFKIPFNESKTFSLQFNVKPEEEFIMDRVFKLANGTFVTKSQEKKIWSLKIVDGVHVKLTIMDRQQTKSRLHFTLSNDNSLNSTMWNLIAVFFKNDGFIEMSVNEYVVKGRYDSLIDHFYGDLSFGSIDSKFVGCVKDVRIDHNDLDPRVLNERTMVFGKITLDDCQLVNPCNRPDACEHDGICIPNIDNGTYSCDCSHTGYIGKTCHFSLYRKSCEEIHLMDKQATGIYLIDIDRNGPTPPAHVICDIGDDADDATSSSSTNANSHNHRTIRTIIEHNIQHQVIVREKGRKGSFYMDIHYRDFSRDMLSLLVQRSDRCQQYLRYECNNAPLSLSTYTLLYSIKPDHKLIRIDSGRSRGCSCSRSMNGGAHSTNMCSDPSKHCNCDDDSSSLSLLSSGWKHDDGYLTDKNDVGITKMMFLQYPNASRDSEAHLFLGNLSCVDFNTQKYEITFKTKESYLEVDGWTGGGREMAISFKTTANNAVIFYQSHLDTTSTYFKAVIISENEISFEYCARGRKSIVTVSSSRCLNCGQWQHLLIERNDNQMRVSINQNFKMLYLKENEQFINFDGKLYVGGAPLRYLQGLEIKLGFIGCLRGLVLDGQVIDLHRYLNVVRYPNIESGCRPYCKPNLCQNQGICIELWGSYLCKCANPIAHYGTNCQININENAITIKGPTYIRKEISDENEMKSILSDDLILSFRTHLNDALLFYAHDNCNNFIQLHIANGSSVVLSFNFHQKIIQQKIDIGKMLVTGHPVQVKVTRSNQETLLLVNKQSITIPYGVKLMDSGCSLDDADIEHSIVKMKNEVNELLIGGVDSDDPEQPAFVGCIQGLMTGKQLLIEKETEMNDFEIGNSSLVKKDCKMLCDELPCNNGGICTEDWLHDSIICDCESTSYRGQTCDVDIGAHFQKDQSSVVYFLDKELMDFNYVDITFAFSSSFAESSTLLMIRYVNSSRYLHIALLANGKLLIEEDNGHEYYSDTIESEEEETFFDSYRHWIRYTRKGKSVQIIVDSVIYVIEEKFNEYLGLMPQSNENVIIVGSNKLDGQSTQNSSLFGLFSNFRGCISNSHIQMDDLKIDPFESAFGIRSGLNDVKVNGQIKQGICASFKIHQPNQQTVPHKRIDQSLTLLNRKEIWFNRPKPQLIPYQMKNIYSYEENNIYWTKSRIVITISLIYLSVVLFCVSIYLWKIEKRYRLLKFQGETPFFHKNQMNHNHSFETKYKL